MPTFEISSGLPSYPVGLTDKEASQLVPIYRAINLLAQRVSLATNSTTYSQSELAGLDRFVNLTGASSSQVTIKAGAAIAYGQLVTLTASGADVVANLATNTVQTSWAHAVCNSPSGLATGEYGSAIFMTGLCPGVTGSVFGSQYYLSTAGALQLAKPTGTAVRVQPVAIGLGAAGVYLNIPTLGDWLP